MKNMYVTAVRCALAAMLLFGVATQSHAITIETTKSEYVPGGARYYFVVTNWGYLWESSPCGFSGSNATTCTISLIALHDTNQGFEAVGSYASWSVPLRPDSNMGDLLRDLESKGFGIPLSGSIFVESGKITHDLCISFIYSIPGAIRSFGPCQPVAVLPLECDITGNPIINYQTLADNAVDGATASTKLNAQCKGPASMIVSTSTTNAYGVKLKEDDSLYSKITVNGKDATAGINVPIKDGVATPLTITSTLVKRGELMPGPFLGFTVVTISPP